MRNASFAWVAVASLVAGCGGSSKDSGKDTAIRLTIGGAATGFVTYGYDGSAIWTEGFTSNAPMALIAAFIPYATHSPPLPTHRPTLGLTWTGTGSSGPVTGTEYPVNATAVVESVTETVTVPAGTFHGCVKVVETFAYPSGYTPGEPREARYQRWYAGGVGPVKSITTSDNGTAYTAVLSAYGTAGAAADDFFPLALGYTWTLDVAGFAGTTFTVVEIK